MKADDRFWAKVDKVADGGCWVWTGGTSQGYGHFTPNGRGTQIRAHRYAYREGLRR